MKDEEIENLMFTFKLKLLSGCFEMPLVQKCIEMLMKS
jgi:hypothetical protein